MSFRSCERLRTRLYFGPLAPPLGRPFWIGVACLAAAVLLIAVLWPFSCWASEGVGLGASVVSSRA